MVRRTFTSAVIPKPDWAIVGVPAPGGEGVMLVASKHLTYGKLQSLAQDEIPLEWMTAGWMRTGEFITLSLGVDDFVVVVGATYAEAFSILFGQWVPREGETLAISASTPAIEQAPS